MLRRVIIAVGSVVGVLALVGQPAGADYPPVPIPKVVPKVVPKAPTPTVAPKKVVRKPVVVVVRGAPVPKAQRLVRTGTSSTLPLTALATASVGLGVTLVCLARLRLPGHARRRHRSR
ncbi:MAG TPA: hypothetical protein VHG90_14045 [Acidimicrobiales bacterium]|nr:hypothetical protein [Acidimicrobiales bacterium]